MNADLPGIGTITWRKSGVVALLAMLFVAPMILTEFLTGLIIDIMILGLFAMAFNLLFGYTGLLSFGHAAYYATGAYLVALVLSGELLPGAMQTMLPAMVLGVLGATIVAAVFGMLCVQRGEIYFAMLTLAFSMLLYRGVIQFDGITGGVNGKIISNPEIDLGVATYNALNTEVYFYFTLLFIIGAIVLLWRIVHSPYGELLKAIRENPERAEFIGLPVKYYQWSSFVLSGAIAGLAGALIAPRIFVVTPNTAHWLKSAEAPIVTLIGGPSSFFGPIVGAAIFIWLEQILADVTSYWQAALGAVLIPLVIYAQNGVTGLVVGEESIPNYARDVYADRFGGAPDAEEGDQ
jgi:branched-chain amino acid transport system permease protein